jgi:hypothetical protein
VRKWLVMGLVVIGVAIVTLAVTIPGEGSVTYHKRVCRQAMRGMAGQQTLLDRWTMEIDSWLGRAVVTPGVQYERHSKALRNLGYLEKREFPVTNNPPLVTARLAHWARKELPRDDLWIVSCPSNKVVIQAERHSMKKWEEMVRRADVPASAD